MEKRYQVFISSTFQDLKNARQEVSHALLRADCFPAGMELFPAADEEQFEFIKTVIDQSDYYIIISAGRYGSVHPETGLSYTEMEYDYAVETGKPVIRLLHNDPKSLETEGDRQLANLLNFRDKMKSERMVAFWETPDQLGKEVTFALLDLKKAKPAIGWVRGDQIASTEAVNEIAALGAENIKLEKKVLKLTSQLDDASNYLSPLQELSEQVVATVHRCVGTITETAAISVYQLVTAHIEKNGFQKKSLIEHVRDKLPRSDIPKSKEIPILVSALMAMELIEPSNLGSRLTVSVLGTRVNAFFHAKPVLG